MMVVDAVQLREEDIVKKQKTKTKTKTKKRKYRIFGVGGRAVEHKQMKGENISRDEFLK